MGKGGCDEPMSQCTFPDPSEISAESWYRAEQAAEGVLQYLQPTLESEQRRKDIVEFVRDLVSGVLGTDVVPLGSFPLKTYLPHRDIDLTALVVSNSIDTLACQISSILKAEEKNKHGKFEVKGVEYINTELKVVRSVIQNVVVNISFNQFGGLDTLSFLEQVNSLVGKNNLYKRSIMLIKAWSYHEARLLGAKHGLISTYALNIMILYILNIFHSSLDGPLAVLYKFLDYYREFDWDNYCISLYGPISLSSLPTLVAEATNKDGGDFFFSKEFMKSSVERSSEPAREGENKSHIFKKKHLNIVDPLREDNNLGRSVSFGNFHRIRGAFKFGAQELGHILLLSPERIAHKFFPNIIDKHGSGRLDLKDAVNGSPRQNHLTDLSGDYMNHSETLKLAQWKLDYLSFVTCLPVYPCSSSSWDANKHYNPNRTLKYLST